MKKIMVIMICVCILLSGCGEKKTLRDEVFEEYKYVSNTIKEPTITGTKALKISDMTDSYKNNYTTISGNVKNIGDSTISYYEITIKLMDKNGEVLDSVWTNNSGQFQAGESSKWEKSIKYDERMEKYSASVTKVSYK